MYYNRGSRPIIRKETTFPAREKYAKQWGSSSSGSFRYCCTNSVGENSSIVGYTFAIILLLATIRLFQLQDKSNVDIQALCDCSVYVINYQQMADFYDTNDAHQKLGRRIAETLLWEVYDRMISMYSLTPEERYLGNYQPLSRLTETDNFKRTGFLSSHSSRNITTPAPTNAICLSGLSSESVTDEYFNSLIVSSKLSKDSAVFSASAAVSFNASISSFKPLM